MKKYFRLIILHLALFSTGLSIAQNKIQWVEIGEGTYDHGFIFPYKIKLYVPYGVRDIGDLKEGLLPMKFRLDWLPITLKQKKVKSIFTSQLKNNFDNLENYRLSENIVENFLIKLPKTKKHDIWIFEYFPDRGTHFIIEDKTIHQLVGAELNRALIQSWINKNPMLTSSLFNRLLKVQ